MLEDIIEQGWSVTQSRRGGHLHARSPEGRLVVMTAGAFGRVGVGNVKRDLRRAGADV